MIDSCQDIDYRYYYLLAISIIKTHLRTYVDFLLPCSKMCIRDSIRIVNIYLHYFENIYMFSENNKFYNNIKFYARYVDDTFIIFNGTLRQIEKLKHYLNSLSKNIQFTLETEVDNKLHFLDLTVTKYVNKFHYKIYRKPTTTDITIHADSHHPYSQKIADYNSFVHRLVTIPLNQKDFQDELDIIRHIAIANGYKISMIDRLLKRHLYKTRSHHNTIDDNKVNNNKNNNKSI